MAWSLFKVVRNSAQAYSRIGKVDGAWSGFKDGFIKSEAETRFFATREMGARNPMLTNVSLIGSGAVLVGIGGLDKEGNVNIPFVGAYSLPFSSKVNGWLSEHIGLGGTSAGKVLQGVGAVMTAAGFVGIMARAFYKNGSVAEGKIMWKDYSLAQKISGTSLAATKGVLVDLGWASGANIVTVIAPLHGVITATSYLSHTYLEPAQFTSLMLGFYKNTFSQFYVPADVTAKLSDLPDAALKELAAKYPDVTAKDRTALINELTAKLGDERLL
jgi:hypothetical protein